MATTKGSLTFNGATSAFAIAAASIPSLSDSCVFQPGAAANFFSSGATPNASSGLQVAAGGMYFFNGDPTKLQFCGVIAVPLMQVEFYQGLI